MDAGKSLKVWRITSAAQSQTFGLLELMVFGMDGFGKSFCYLVGCRTELGVVLQRQNPWRSLLILLFLSIFLHLFAE